MRDAALGLALAALVALLAFGLAGCKYSDVLTEHIEDPDIGVLDENAEPIFKHNPDAPPDPDWVSEVLSQSERLDEQEQDLPEYDQDEHQDQQTDNRQYRDDTSYTQNATQGTQASPRQGDNANTGAGPSRGSSASASTEEQTPDDQTPSSSEETLDEVGDDPSNGPANTGPAPQAPKVFDTTGAIEELPEDVGSIAAAGQYATIVQMLAGSGGLVAADDEWVDMAAAKGLFAGEGVDQLARAWHGNQATGLTLDMDALLAAKPDVVLADGRWVLLSQEQTDQLVEAGINVVVAPALGGSDASDASIGMAVALVSQLLSSANTQFDPTQMAALYAEQHDRALDDCLAGNGGYSVKAVMGMYYAGIYQGESTFGEETTNISGTRYTTAFIDSWTFDVNPAPTANRSYSDYALDYLNGSVVDASDGAGLSASGTSRNFMLIDYYLQVSGVVNNAYESSKPALAGEGDILRSMLVIPGESGDLVTDSLAQRLVSRTAPSALWYSPNSIGVGTIWETVGDESFPGVLTRTNDIAQRVAASASKTNGLYNVGQPYEVRVVPRGVAGSWADGTVESFLLAPWAFCAFRDGDFSTADSYVASFYRTFYRCGSFASAIDDYNTAYTASSESGRGP